MAAGRKLTEDTWSLRTGLQSACRSSPGAIYQLLSAVEVSSTTPAEGDFENVNTGVVPVQIPFPILNSLEKPPAYS